MDEYNSVANKVLFCVLIAKYCHEKLDCMLLCLIFYFVNQQQQQRLMYRQ